MVVSRIRRKIVRIRILLLNLYVFFTTLMTEIKIRLDKFGSGSRHAGHGNSPIPGAPEQGLRMQKKLCFHANNFFSFIFVVSRTGSSD
jgi:hypothetical protein